MHSVRWATLVAGVLIGMPLAAVGRSLLPPEFDLLLLGPVACVILVLAFPVTAWPWIAGSRARPESRIFWMAVSGLSVGPLAGLIAIWTGLGPAFFVSGALVGLIWGGAAGLLAQGAMVLARR